MRVGWNIIDDFGNVVFVESKNAWSIMEAIDDTLNDYHFGEA